MQCFILKMFPAKTELSSSAKKAAKLIASTILLILLIVNRHLPNFIAVSGAKHVAFWDARLRVLDVEFYQQYQSSYVSDTK